MSLKGKKVLVVEDDESTRKALVSKLESEGYSVFEASDGEMGLKLAESSKPDIVLLDIILPKFSGDEVLKKMNAMNLEKKPIVVVLTNVQSTENISNVLSEGCFEYFIKSDTSLDELMKFLKGKIKF